MIKPARLDQRAGDERRVGQDMAQPDDILQAGEDGVPFHRADFIGVRAHDE